MTSSDIDDYAGKAWQTVKKKEKKNEGELTQFDGDQSCDFNLRL